MSTVALRQLVVGSFIALIALGLAWELWLAPLRPGAWLLSLKVAPLVLALPALRSGRVRAFQGWSMGVLAYLCEGAVRAASDHGPSALLALLEAALALLAFTGILLYVRRMRRDASPRAPLRAPGRPRAPAAPDRRARDASGARREDR